MHAKEFLHKLLAVTIHKTRIKTLSDVVETIIQTKQLNLTKIGRAMPVSGQERSGIRRMDRLLANKFYQEESKEIYAPIAKLVLQTSKRPLIIVDWSKLPNTNCYVLRAAVAAEGRALTIYEEVHPKKKEGNRKVHTTFLQELKSVIPAGCSPIIVTDAGFKNPWFKAVSHLDWDFVGRVRGKTHYEEDGIYREISVLFEKASTTPKYLGDKILTHKNPLLTSFYVVKQKLKGRKKLNKDGAVSQHKDSVNYSRSLREPWLLVSSLGAGHQVAKKVVKIYKQRMTIEEGFRDMKSTKYGFSMKENKTLNPERLTTWLLLAALASLFAWIVGYHAEAVEAHLPFQANTIKNRRVLSFFYLGCQIIRKKLEIPIKLNNHSFIHEAFAS